MPTRATASERGITAALATFISESRHTPLPPDVRHAACRAFANWLGCALGAIDDPSVQPILRVASSLSSRQQASVVGRELKLDVVNAALVNGAGANALDYDDMHTPTLIHPTGAVVAAALAASEDRDSAGDVLLSAIVTGIEVECRLGRALFPAHYDAGWHITATLGTLGAAAAASVVLGLDASRAAHALGIASTQAGGLRAMLPNACKSFNIGKAAAAGAMSALLAEADLESATDVLEAKFGLFDVFGHPENIDTITRDLGKHYAVPEISIKPYPCGVVIHPLIDACLELVRNHDVDIKDVRTITALVHPRAIELAGRQHPETAITGRFSLHHAAALALARRSAGLAAFDSDVNDPQLVALRSHMAIEGDAGLRPGQARVKLELADGTRLEHAVEHPSGSPQRPLSDAALHAKFIELATRAVDSQSAESLFEICMGLERMKSIAELRQHWMQQVPRQREDRHAGLDPASSGFEFR